VAEAGEIYGIVAMTSPGDYIQGWSSRVDAFYPDPERFVLRKAFPVPQGARTVVSNIDICRNEFISPIVIISFQNVLDIPRGFSSEPERLLVPNWSCYLVANRSSYLVTNRSSYLVMKRISYLFLNRSSYLVMNRKSYLELTGAPT
jgi:hypothetical protein